MNSLRPLTNSMAMCCILMQTGRQCIHNYYVVVHELLKKKDIRTLLFEIEVWYFKILVRISSFFKLWLCVYPGAAELCPFFDWMCALFVFDI